MRVVSNTSPLIAFSHLGELHILERLFPSHLAREFGRQHLPEWIQVQALSQPAGVQVARAALGEGESEAIAVALAHSVDLVLLDDKAARRLAVTLRLRVIGTLGLLLRAKEAGLIDAVRPRLEALRTLPFHISPRLLETVLAEANE